MENRINVVSSVNKTVIGQITGSGNLPINTFPQNPNVTEKIVTISENVVKSTGVAGVNIWRYAHEVNITEADAITYGGWPTGTNCFRFGKQ